MTKSRRSRIAFLASTSFVAANILAGAGALMATSFTPSVALAACVPDGAVVANPASATETCNGADAAVSYTAVSHKFDVILDGATVGPGGALISSAGANDLGITTVLNASTITNAAGAGLTVSTNGNVKVDFSDTVATTQVSGTVFGIIAATSAGNTDVFLGVGSSAKSSTAGGVGIRASSVTGVTTVVNDGAVLDGGLYLDSNVSANYSGKGSINNSTGIGLRLESFAGGKAAAINATVDGAITSASAGIAVAPGGTFFSTGTTTITTNKTVTSTGGDGINIYNEGKVTLATNAAVSGGGKFGVTITGGGAGGITYDANADVTGATGINIAENSTGTATLTINNTAKITGGTGDGVKVSAAGNILVSSKAGTSVQGGTNGMVLTATGVGSVTGFGGGLSGDISATTGDALKISAGTGGVGITTSGTIKGGTAGDGIDITSAGGINLITNGKVSGDPAVLLNDNSAVGINHDLNGGADALLDAVKATETGTGNIVLNIKSAVLADTDKNGTGDGVFALGTSGQVKVNISAAGSIDGEGQHGVNIADGKTAAGLALIVVNDGTVGTLGNKMDFVGIKAFLTDPTGAGSISITGAGEVHSDSAAVWTNNLGSGDTTIAIKGAVTSGGLTWALIAQNEGGTVDITTGPGLVTGDNGVLATSTGKFGAGVVKVHVGGDITGLNVVGITAASSGTGTVTVDAVGDGNVFGKLGDGIDATNSSATGAVVVDLSGKTVGVEGGTSGIVARTVGGDINVVTSGLVKAGTGIGVDAQASKGGNVFVNGIGPVTVTGAGAGIFVRSDTGNLNVGNTGVGYNGAIDPQGGGFGIDAQTGGTASAGNVFVKTGVGGTISGNAAQGIVAGQGLLGTGSVTVDQNGAIGTAGNFVTATGVNAFINNTTSTSAVDVTANADIFAGVNGVNANTQGLGSVTVNQTGGAITAKNVGISATIFNAKNVAGNVTVNTSAGVSIAADANGINATTTGEGDVLVKNGGTTKGGAVAGDGIFAAIAGPGLAGSDGTVTVNNLGAATAWSDNGAGIKATSNANDEVAVSNAGTVVGSTFGVNAINSGVGGGVTVTQTSGSTWQTGADTGAGISATITNAGNSDQVWVNLTGGSVSANGDGVFAQTAGTGLVKVNVGAGVTVTGGASGGKNGDGVVAIGLGGGNVLVINDGTINGDPGIIASAVGFGTATTISSGAVAAVDQGILSTTEDGANTVSITGAGTVTSTTAAGIEAKSTKTATIDVKTAAGTKITTTGGKQGIFANQTGSGNVTIQALGQIDAGTSGIDAKTTAGTINILTGPGKISGAVNGILANSTGAFNVTVTTGAGGVGGGGFGFGILATSNGGDATVNLGSGGSFDNGVDAATNGAGNATVTVGGDIVDNSFEGARAAATAGNATVTLLAGKTITSAGAGIIATTTSGAAQVTTGAGSTVTSTNSFGIISQTTAGGTILVTANGAIDTTAGAGDGINAQTTGVGGAIQIFTGTGTINTGGRGILASAAGVNNITIHTGTGAITAAGLHGIRAGSAGGNVSVTADGDVTGQFGIETGTQAAGTTLVVTNAKVTGTAGDGILAVTPGSGTVTVIANGAVQSTGGAGINADGGTGKVTVLANSTVTGTAGGIFGDGDGAAEVFISAIGAVDGGAGNGINATSDTGNLTVNAASSVTGKTGIFSFTGGAGTTSIKAAGQVTGTAGHGINAWTTGTGLIDIATAGVTGTDIGISGTSTGGGAIKVTTTGPVVGDSDSSGVGNGVDLLSNGGDLTVSLGGTVSGASGVVLVTSGSGVATLNGGAAGNTITGTVADGINVTADTGAIVIGSGPGTRLQQKVSGAVNGIVATSNGPITIFTANDITGTTGNGVQAASAGAGAAVVVDTTGGAITAGANGIDAKSTGAGGTVSVVNTDAVEAGARGINVQADGSASIDNKGAIDKSGNGAIGLFAQSVNGPVQVDNTGAIGKAGAGNGVSNIGIGAVITGGGTNTVTVNNSGAIFVDAGGTAGILAVTNGTGDVTVNNTGVIDPPLFGIFMSGGGNVTANTAANVTGQLAGTHAASFGGSTKLVKVNVTAGAAVTGTAGNGIEAFGPLGANIIVDVTKSGAITGTGAGANGIFAQGKGDVTVSGGAGTITGGASGAAWGIKAISNPGGAGAGGVVKVTTGGLVTGAQGILAFSDGTDAGDSVTVSVNGNVTATAGFGILTKAVNGLNKVDLVTGTVNATGKDGISSSSTGTGGVTITTAAGTNIEANSAAANDIKAVTTGASGNINITTLGTLSQIGHAGNDAIFAQVNNAASTSNINITAQDQIWALNNAIEATTNGLGAITIVADTVAPASGLAIVDGHNNGINAGITNALNVSALNITVGDAGGAVTTSITQFNAGGNGILASHAGTGALNVTTGPGVTITALGAGSNGINAQGAGGAVTVSSSSGGISATNDGIFASGTGAISVTNASAVTNATDAGIRVAGGAGQVDVTNTGSLANLNLAQFGIIAVDTTGKLTVTNSAAIGAAGAGNGVDNIGIAAIATGAGANTVTVNNSGNIFVDGGGTAGYLAASNGTGDVTVNNSGVIDPPLFGIFVASGGNATANTSANVTGQTGIRAQSFGGAAATATVKVTNTAVITGTVGNGIEVFGTPANTKVDTTAGGNVLGATNGIASTVTGNGTTTINTLTSSNSALIKNVTGTGGEGIRATSTGSGAISVTTGNVTGSGKAGNQSSGVVAISTGGGNVSVSTTGAIAGDATGNAGGIGAAGIAATTTGAGNVTVTTNLTSNVVSGSVSGGNVGIAAVSGATGSATVNSNVAVTASGAAAVNAATGPVGIAVASGTAGAAVGTATSLTLNVNANVFANNGRAIVTNASNNAKVTIGAALVQGGGDAGHPVVDITTVVGATTTLVNGGTIQSKQGPAIASYGDLALTAAGGALVFNNNGTLLGRIDASKASSVTMTNTTFTSWHTTGTSTFSPGADSLTNTGLIATNANAAATTLDFGAGADSFTNSAGGVLVAGEGPQGAANLVITGLETLTNNGQVVFGSNSAANPFVSDGVINDKINAAGTTFGGTGKLLMDADLFSISQASCAALTAADCLAVSATAGLNTIVVKDNGAHAVGAFNPTGIALVTGSTNAGANFKLDPTSSFYNPNKFGGVLDKPGLFFYDLAWSPANGGTSLLIGVPDTEAFELSEVSTQATSVWYTSTQTWFDRQADLRVTLAGRAEGWAPAVWLKVVGEWTDRDNTQTFSLFNKSYTFDVGYRQDTVGLIGGVDVLRGSNGTEGYVFGVQAGYLDSDVRFHSASRAKLSGPTFGVYGTYMNGGFFLDGIVNANFMNLDVSLPGVAPPSLTSASSDVRAYGGQIEGGYQMPIGANGFWEPIASLSYVHTDVHDLNLGAAGIATFPDATSFRGALGLRLGMTGDFQYYRVRATLTGRYINEFDGDNTMVFISPGPSNLQLIDSLNGGFGEVTLGTNMFATGGHLSAFANASIRFQSDYQATSVTAGFRYQW